MKYLATYDPNGACLRKLCSSLSEATAWLDSMNNNLEKRTMIEIYDDEGRKTDGFFYAE